MSDGETGVGGGCEGLLWENQTWAKLSNSENSSGGGVGGFEDNQFGEKQQVQQVETLMMGTDQDQMQAAAVKGKKRRAAAAGVTSKNRVSTDDQLGTEGKLGGAESDDHEMHIWTERERRKKMRNMFANLHALLPQLPAKADKSTIVDEAINSIKSLQETLQNLQKEKVERLQGGSSSSTAMINYDPNPQNVACDDDSREAFLAAMVSSSYLATPENNASNSISTPQYYRPIIFETWTSANVVLNICGDEAQINVCAPKKPGIFTAICHILENNNISVVSAHVSSDCNRSMYMIQARANGAPNHFVQRYTVEKIFTHAVGEILLFVS